MKTIQIAAATALLLTLAASQGSGGSAIGAPQSQPQTRASIDAGKRPADRAHVADCDLVMAGSGIKSWRRESLNTGPLGIRRSPLRDMTPASAKRKHRGLATKAPVLVEGHRPVTLRVPAALRGRVFLYYGPDRANQFTFNRFDGFSAIRFHPCTDKPRTVWPGGIRVVGRSPVRLLVKVKGWRRFAPLSIGRPTLYRPGAARNHTRWN